MLKNKKNKDEIEYICPKCKTKELIPTKIVEMLDVAEENLMDSSVSGHYLETFVISELIKNIDSNTGLYYYRDKDGKEIDLILFENDTLYPFEIKKTASPNKDMIKNFSILNKTKKKIGKGASYVSIQRLFP